MNGVLIWIYNNEIQSKPEIGCNLSEPLRSRDIYSEKNDFVVDVVAF